MPIQVLWLTDIHLNFLSDEQIDRFLATVRQSAADVVLIGGDIGEANSVAGYLSRISEQVPLPIFFVLGNHDFYFGSIARVRAEVATLCHERPNLTYLTDVQDVWLTPTIGLVGHDGWADGREGDYERSLIMMQDYRLIAELAPFFKRDRWSVLKEMGDQSATHIENVLPGALEKFEHVVLLTHVPPLREACWHEGSISDDEWAPHFVCQAMGETIARIMRDYPQRQLTVLCGHTHGGGETHPLPNVVIHTGAAEYGVPSIARQFFLP